MKISCEEAWLKSQACVTYGQQDDVRDTFYMGWNAGVDDIEQVRAERDALQLRLNAADQRVDDLEAMINTPHTDEWFEAVRIEAAHQINRFGTGQDAGKAPADWFWLLGYLGGKALAAALAGNAEKAKHHTISSGAAMLNWFRAMTGDTVAMRPGLDRAGE